jgi:hypothetical protein
MNSNESNPLKLILNPIFLKFKTLNLGIKLRDNMQKPRTLQSWESNGLKYLYLGCILLFLSTPLPAAAQRLDMIPSLQLNGGYDDNILFNRTKPVDDFYTSVKPEINLGLTSDRYSLGIDSYAEIFRYKKEKDLDYESYRYDMGGSYRLSQRLNISSDFGYIKDTTLNSELEETGRVLEREDRERYQWGGTLSYGLNEVSGIDIDYQYQSTEYKSRDSIDRIANRVRLSYKRWFNDRLDQVMLQPRYAIADTEDNSDIEYYNLSVGWTHIFSDTLTMRNLVGYGQTITKENGNKESSWTGNADLSITQTGELFSLKIGLRNNIRLDADGKIKEVDRFYCYISRKMTERLSAKLYGGIYVNRPIGNLNSVNSVFYDVKPELSYQITENHVMNAFYRYSYEEDRITSENQKRTRNVIELNLVFRFPMQK